MVWRLPLIYDALLLYIHISTMSTLYTLHCISYPKHNVIMWLKPRWKVPRARPCLSGFVFASRVCNALFFSLDFFCAIYKYISKKRKHTNLCKKKAINYKIMKLVWAAAILPSIINGKWNTHKPELDIPNIYIYYIKELRSAAYAEIRKTNSQ